MDQDLWLICRLCSRGFRKIQTHSWVFMLSSEIQRNWYRVTPFFCFISSEMDSLWFKSAVWRLYMYMHMHMLCWFYKEVNAFILKIKVWVLLCMLRHICDKRTSITMWAEAAFAPNLVKTTDLVWRGGNIWIFCHLACCDYGATSPNKGSSKNKNLTVSNEIFFRCQTNEQTEETTGCFPFFSWLR